MTISAEDVEHVARLARLDLSSEEIELFRSQLQRILEHAERVTSLDTDGVEPSAHAIKLTGVMRDDEVAEGLSQRNALSNAPAEESGQFRVPRILEEE